MALLSIGDLAQNAILRRQTANLKSTAQTAGVELTSGQAADPAKHLRGDVTRLAAIETSLTRTAAFQASAQDVAMTATSMQQALASIAQMTEGISGALLSAGTLAEARTMDSVLQDVGERFEAVIATLNTQVGQGSLFAGIATDGPALAGSDVILSALEAAITASGATNSAETEAAVAAWFSDPAGFDSIGYIGGLASQPQRVSTDDRVSLGFTAQDPALKNTLKALAMAALVQRENLPNGAGMKADILRRSGELLMQSDSDRAVLSGRIGIAEARTENASMRNSAEASSLQMMKSDLLGIDPFEAATRLEDAQSQLETLYAITARLSRLSLVDFLR